MGSVRMTSMSMMRYTSTAVLLLILWTLPSSGEVSQNSSDGICSAPTSQNGALALIPTFENDTLYLAVNELNDLSLIVKQLKDLSLIVKELRDLRLAMKELNDLFQAMKELKHLNAAANNPIDNNHKATDRMFLMMVKCLSVIGLGLLGLNFYKTVMEREVQPPQNTSYITHRYAYNTSSDVQNLNIGSGSSNAVGNVAAAADRNSCSSDQSMPGTAEVPTNRSESADPAGLTNTAPDGVPVGAPDAVPVEVPVEVPVNVQVDEPVPASTTDNTASLVTMKTNSQNSDDKEDDETLVPLSLETPH